MWFSHAAIAVHNKEKPEHVVGGWLKSVVEILFDVHGTEHLLVQQKESLWH